MRCDACGRTLTDPASQRDRLGPECRTKTTPRLTRVQALRSLVDLRSPDAGLAAEILRRMDTGKRLTRGQERFAARLTDQAQPLPGAPSRFEQEIHDRLALDAIRHADELTEGAASLADPMEDA